MADVESELVNKFPTSTSRRRIFDGLTQYIVDLESNGVSGRLWIDGSFVTGKNHPSDVDVISFVPFDLLNDLLPNAQEFVQNCLIGRTLPPIDPSLPLANLLDGREGTKKRYKVHSFSIPCAESSHPSYMQLCGATKSWGNFFGHTKKWLGRSGVEMKLAKGVLDLPFGEPVKTTVVGNWLQNVI